MGNLSQRCRRKRVPAREGGSVFKFLLDRVDAIIDGVRQLAAAFAAELARGGLPVQCHHAASKLAWPRRQQAAALQGASRILMPIGEPKAHEVRTQNHMLERPWRPFMTMITERRYNLLRLFTKSDMFTLS